MISALVARSPSASEDEDEDREIHRGVVCDGCERNPMIGERYKCNVCEDFDLCGDCKDHRGTLHHADHSLRRIKIAKRRINASALRDEAINEDVGEPQPSTSEQPLERRQESSGAQGQTQSDQRAAQSVRPRDTQLRPRADSNPQYEVGVKSAKILI